MVSIIVEGKDDEKFIVKYLAHLSSKEYINLNSQNFSQFTQIMGSKSKLLDSNNDKYLKITQQIKQSKIKKVLFIFDCDFEEDDNRCGGIENSKKCFIKLIEELSWSIPIDLYIFDKNLDYFLLETIKDKKCYQDFENLEKCLEVEKIKKNKKPIANLYRDLYPNEGFDFSHPNFNELKEKLINLFKEE